MSKPTIKEIMETQNWGRNHPWKATGKPPVMSKRAYLMLKYYPDKLSNMIKKFKELNNK